MEEDVKKFFDNSPEALELYKIISSYIYGLGEIKTEVMKTQISFGTKRKFTWVWLPQTWVTKRPKESLTLTFALNRRIENEQIESVVEPRLGKWIHHIVIKNSEDFTVEVKQWINEAFNQSL